MSVVHIRINGRDYSIACDDGQEEQLRLLADEVDDRIRALIFRMGGNPGEEMALLLSALTMADEIIENKKEIDKISGEVRRLARVAEQNREQAEGGPREERLLEIEAAMTATLEDIALRIEKIAEQVEIG